ncbi:MAG: serine hydrolase domain-containing protein [Candidatus Hermodarchaeota archaeon]
MNRTMNPQRASFFSTLGLVIIVASLVVTPTTAIHFNLVSTENLVRDYWPTLEWRTATPESQAMDSEKLNDMMEYIEEQGFNIHSVIVIRHGYIVLEQYPGDIYTSTMLHMIQSCTKSFTSTLIGIALHEGFIENVDQKMVDFFPTRTIANLDSRKRNITLEHMLTMSEGMYWTELEYPYTDERNTLRQMWYSYDAIQHILDQPIERDPGAAFHYNSGMSILLGAVIEQATGQDVTSFAEDYLFDPIGIDDYTWASMQRSGVLHTDGGLYLTPRDMARLGYLFLNNGTWAGMEIVSPEWVAEATQAHYMTPWWYGYGYQWWAIPNFGVYCATGHYEQKIYVAPEKDLVVVFTADIADEDPHPTDSLLLSYILPAAQEDEVSDGQEIILQTVLTVTVVIALVSPVIIAGGYWLVKKKHFLRSN